MAEQQKNSPVISVIVPVFRVEQYLQKCIDSVLQQIFSDLELILVDDGSDDGSPAICDAAAQQDARVRVIHQANAGLSGARNTGLEHARGDYIYLLDSDDYIHPQTLELMLSRIRQDNSMMAICNLRYVDENGQEIARRIGESPIIKDEVLDRTRAVNTLCDKKNWYYIMPCNKLYVRHLFDEIRFPVGKLHEDQFVAHELLWKCERVSILKEQLYYYLQRSSSIMGQGFSVRTMDEVEGWFTRVQFALQHELYDLAVSAYNGGIDRLKQGYLRLDMRDPAVAERVHALHMQAMQLFPRMMQIPGHSKDKCKFLLFRISPKLYAWVKQTMGLN